jgi:hypothetical protein
LSLSCIIDVTFRFTSDTGNRLVTINKRRPGIAGFCDGLSVIDDVDGVGDDNGVDGDAVVGNVGIAGGGNGANGVIFDNGVPFGV